MSTHNLCFEQKYENYQNFLSENFPFLVVKFSIYLNRHVVLMPILPLLHCSFYHFLTSLRKLLFILLFYSKVLNLSLVLGKAEIAEDKFFFKENKISVPFLGLCDLICYFLMRT